MYVIAISQKQETKKESKKVNQRSIFASQRRNSIMLSPTPLSLLCALLLCLPLAIVFTITTTSTPSSSSSSTIVSSSTPLIQTTTTAVTTISCTTNSTSTGRIRPVSEIILPVPKAKTLEKLLPVLEAKTLEKPQQDESPSFLSNSSFDSGTVQNETEVDYDDEDDNALFNVAGRVSLNIRPPLKKLAFMFLTTTPLPFAPLWELFFNQTPKTLYNIYLHADPSSTYSPPFRGLFAHRVIPSKPTRRNSPTLIAAARRLLSRALLHDKSNYMFALLSPSCIPLHSFNFTYEFLTKIGKSFIEILEDEPGAYGRWAARGEGAMLPEVKFEDFRIGSQFFVLKRKHARLIVRDRRVWSKFKLACLNWNLGTCYPEEHYFPTLLSMVDPGGCVPATLTNVDWSTGSYGGHPRMYHGVEVGPELIWDLRNRKPRYGFEGSNGSNWSVITRRHDPFLFARKFSTDSLWPLMGMANDVLFKD